MGPAIRVLKTRNNDDLFVGFVLGVVPGAVAASMVAISFALIETAVCQPGHKGGYVAPDWFAAIMVSLTIVVGAFASCRAARRDPPMESPSRTMASVILWGSGGGLLSAFAFVSLGFSGYFVVQNNSGPVSYAIFGFVLGSAIAALSRWGTAALAHSPHAGGQAHSLA